MKPIEILLVEDNPADAKLTAEALRESGVATHLTIAHDGIEAMAILHHEGRYADAPLPDLIVMDIHLPRMNGFEVLAAIQADDRLNKVPVVVLTGSVNADERAVIESRPIVRYIVKAPELDAYIDNIRSILSDLNPLH
jgi:two-component system, chemotaxis family, response regulator Rcp1